MKTFLLPGVAILLFAACNNSGQNHEHNHDHGDHAHDTRTEQPAATSQDDAHGHSHGDYQMGIMGGGPHQGLVVDGSNGYHVEMVFDGNNVVFYPLDKNANPIDLTGWSGNVTVQQAGKTNKADLTQRDGKLTAQNVNTSKAFKTIVTLKQGDETTSATFDYNTSAKHTHDHGDGKPHTH